MRKVRFHGCPPVIERNGRKKKGMIEQYHYDYFVLNYGHSEKPTRFTVNGFDGTNLPVTITVTSCTWSV